MLSQTQNRNVNLLTGLYFLAAIIEIMAELFYYKPIIIVFKPMMPALLMLLYWFTSTKRNPLFFVAMTLSLITNILFIPDDAQMLFFGIITFMIHRIIVIILVLALLKPKDFIPIIIATIPFLLLFSYLLANSSDVPDNSFAVLIVQNILIAVLGGIALANYMMSDSKKNSWLLICGLLFVALQFIVFIEKYYLVDLALSSFRPIAMGLNAFAFYTFYEFVMAMERSDNNSLPA